jgi:hypothetical protein
MMPPVEPKYCVHGGFVMNVNDRQVHYVSATVVARLYGLPPGSFIIAKQDDVRGLDFVHLYPRDNGDYRLPRE